MTKQPIKGIEKMISELKNEKNRVSIHQINFDNENTCFLVITQIFGFKEIAQSETNFLKATCLMISNFKNLQNKN